MIKNRIGGSNMKRLMIILVLAIMALGIGCNDAANPITNHDGDNGQGGNNDDDADDSADDDSADADDDIDDGSIDVLEYCDDVWFAFDDCGYYLSDDEGKLIDVTDIIALCEAGDEIYGNPDLIMCMKDNIHDANCDGLGECWQWYQ